MKPGKDLEFYLNKIVATLLLWNVFSFCCIQSRVNMYSPDRNKKKLWGGSYDFYCQLPPSPQFTVFNPISNHTTFLQPSKLLLSGEYIPSMRYDCAL